MKDRAIKVEYPDGSGHETTEKELRKRWDEESPEWVESFLKLMDSQGYAYTRFGGKYSFVKNG